MTELEILHRTEVIEKAKEEAIAQKFTLNIQFHNELVRGNFFLHKIEEDYNFHQAVIQDIKIVLAKSQFQDNGLKFVLPFAIKQ